MILHDRVVFIKEANGLILVGLGAIKSFKLMYLLIKRFAISVSNGTIKV